MITHRGLASALVGFTCAIASVIAQDRGRTPPAGPDAEFSVLVGAPADRSVTFSVLIDRGCQARIDFGTNADRLDRTAGPIALAAGVPTVIELTGLTANTGWFYRVHTRADADAAWQPRDVQQFHTSRVPGDSFIFTVQGDSHPERLGRMFNPDLYVRALTNVAADKPDFHFLMGDDFSIEALIERGTKSQDAVNAVYANQRGFLSIVGKRTPLMLVNGNHEQAAKYLLDGTANNFAVFAGKARTAYFPLPAPDGFYSGNTKPVEHVGLLRDYYAWEWGDALFVVIDPYWHSDAAVDNEAGVRDPRQDAGPSPKAQGESGRDAKRRAREKQGEVPGEAAKPQANQADARRGKGGRDLWQITLGDEQYRWLHSTLTLSDAKFKFVFSHHVLGTGRGGVEQASLYEWGGNDRRGVDRFGQMRPKWEQPIHDLMRDSGVTIFFQGHDHLYARQELDGVIYQSCPNPADPTFTAFNKDAYKSGDIFPNSGHLRITVSGAAAGRGDASCKVEYVRAARPSDEADHGENASIVYEYTVLPRAAAASPQQPPSR